MVVNMIVLIVLLVLAAATAITMGVLYALKSCTKTPTKQHGASEKRDTLPFLPIVTVGSHHVAHSTWPASVYVFTPNTPIASIQSIVDTCHGSLADPTHGQFSSMRVAFLFEKGTYIFDRLRIGYYTSVIGLGETPSDVVLQAQVEVINYTAAISPGSLNNFWRSIENVTVDSPLGYMEYAVAQGCPMRRCIINRNLHLAQLPSGTERWEPYASGGFIANCTFKGTVTSGSQQQFITRNCTLEQGWKGSVWNMVFVGDKGAPPQECSPLSVDASYFTGNQYDVTALTPTIREKPYLRFVQGKYQIVVPAIESNVQGVRFSNPPATRIIDWKDVYVATEADSAQTINAALSRGQHIVFAPGIFALDQVLQVQHQGTVVMGIGMATLQAHNSTGCIQVQDVPNVTVCGLILEATSTPSTALLQFGAKGSTGGPGLISDLFCRVGGAATGPTEATTMVSIHQSGCIVDNIWCWRADHAIVPSGVGWDVNKCQHGLQVHGHDVVAYGLAAEHTRDDIVVWSGERGKTYFFQAEFAYDFPSQAALADHVAFRCSALAHQGHGMGAYSNFSQIPPAVAAVELTATNAFVLPTAGHYTHLFTRFLNNLGGIAHIVNGTGDAVTNSHQLSIICSYP